jgi:hypothetical protein
MNEEQANTYAAILGFMVGFWIGVYLLPVAY